jgi:23S rRNA pseudouridine2604 synthase
MTEPVRLSKRVATLTGCSRAQAEQYIEGGWVRVDGAVVEQPQCRVGEAQKIEIDPAAKLQAVEPATLLWHKPAGIEIVAGDSGIDPALVAAARHWSEDASGVRPLQRHLQRLTPLMPLDRDASGLLVLTQDGRVWRRLTEDVALIEQEFVVDFTGELPGDALGRLNAATTPWDRGAVGCKASRQSDTRLRVVAKGASSAQIAARCRAAGVVVDAVRRLRIGKVSLGKMPVGMWRYQPASERF